VSSTPRKWVKWLSLAEIWYNSSFHTTLKCSPFKALYGWDPSFGTTLVLAEAENDCQGCITGMTEVHRTAEAKFG
jgi:hypothetical protein